MDAGMDIAHEIESYRVVQLLSKVLVKEMTNDEVCLQSPLPSLHPAARTNICIYAHSLCSGREMQT